MQSFNSLNIFIHHALNIHNICIYDNQDVYAKFSLTSDPDNAVSTPVVIAGGKNPLFNHRLHLHLNHNNNNNAAILKCEIWMSSRARDLLEDQLLGFALVPLSAVAGNLTQDFSLSSTDLLHSPAGIVKLTLSFDDNNPCVDSIVTNSSSISSEFVILDPAGIEFPEIGVDKQNQEMVSEFVHLGACFDAASCSASECRKEEDEESAMQKQIVEMYVKSMQQFTESLAKMKLPMDLNNPRLEDDGDQKLGSNKKDGGSRVFYGSRAFF